ncbi:MAG: DNA polymerase I, partial [Bacteroidales bacterium]|nr:DNA polymerase I [Bacteroidales bacterium]
TVKADVGQQSLFDLEEPADYETINHDREFVLLTDKSEQKQFVEQIAKESTIVFHFLTDSSNQTIAGIAFAATEGKVAFVPLRDSDDWKCVQPIFEADNVQKIVYNAKQLKHWLADRNMRLKGDIFDVQLAHYLLYSEARHTLDFIASSVLNTNIYDIDIALGKTLARNFIFDNIADKDLVKDSMCERVDIIGKLYPVLKQQMEDTGVYNIYSNIEMPLVDVLFAMEREGVRIDTDYLKHYSLQLQEEKLEIENKIYSYANKTFNIASPKQLGEILFEELKIIDKAPKTATKQYSTAEDVLQKLVDKHPIIPLILEYRSLSKLISTYLEALPKLISPTTNRLHTTFNQTVTATGRLSSNNPNLQNIPIRTERGREMRKAFVPRNDEYVLMAADYSQIELRIIASLSGDKNMIEAFKSHYDIHAATAAKIYKLPMEEVTSDLRRNAKSVNFGIVYGISPFGLSEQLNISRKEAATLIEEYFVQYPDIKKYIDDNIAFAREHGYAQTLLGRRRYLPDINSRNNAMKSFAERNSVNMPIQGTSADMIKIAMNEIYKEFDEKGLKSKMILQVHDELVLDVYKPELEEVKAIVADKMVNALTLDLPIEVGVDIGDNWLEAH